MHGTITYQNRPAESVSWKSKWTNYQRNTHHTKMPTCIIISVVTVMIDKVKSMHVAKIFE